VSFGTITLCVASQRLFVVVVVVVVVVVAAAAAAYFVIDSVRKLLDKPSYIYFRRRFANLSIDYRLVRFLWTHLLWLFSTSMH
jgi:hypothetical protein